MVRHYFQVWKIDDHDRITNLTKKKITNIKLNLN